MAVLVTHPGRQHSHQAALALFAEGLLAGYWCGAPALEAQGGRLLASLLRRFHTYSPVPLPRSLVRWRPTTPGARRIGWGLLPHGGGAWVDYAASREFDGWVARRWRSVEPTAVLCCEISALSTFRAARRAGRVCLLDAPSLHHTAQDRLHGTTDPPALHRRIVATKDAEIALAHHVLTVSPIARETYLEAGTPEDRVHSVLLGADLELFAPPAAARPKTGEFRFVFAGARLYRKGFDLLVEAMSKVHARYPEARLLAVGPAGDAEGALPTGHPAIERLAPRTQVELARLFGTCHCLVLPSRNDSYGMVVAEALATGLPAVVSDMVGSKVLVQPGTTGWIIPVEDQAALTERLLACVEEREKLIGMGAACRAAAATATWDKYRQRFAHLVADLIGASALRSESTAR
ncbi:MAG TPA: glycosyltransferase family 4 protein [Thermoanaerobaculia bacterium]|nr:glycosyltransferase family 4 protein [Thermoanaerobaculia bacterium]